MINIKDFDPNNITISHIKLSCKYHAKTFFSTKLVIWHHSVKLLFINIQMDILKKRNGNKYLAIIPTYEWTSTIKVLVEKWIKIKYLIRSISHYFIDLIRTFILLHFFPTFWVFLAFHPWELVSNTYFIILSYYSNDEKYDKKYMKINSI